MTIYVNVTTTFLGYWDFMLNTLVETFDKTRITITIAYTLCILGLVIWINKTQTVCTLQYIEERIKECYDFSKWLIFVVAVWLLLCSGWFLAQGYAIAKELWVSRWFLTAPSQKSPCHHPYDIQCPPFNVSRWFS